MKIIKNEYIVPVDVDGTLVIHVPQTGPREQGVEYVEVKDPVAPGTITVKPHNPNIRLLMEESHRGAHIIVWSRGGHEWAANVIKALKLEKYVDTIMTKPLAYIDDVDVKDWLAYRVYLNPNDNYKNNKEKL